MEFIETRIKGLFEINPKVFNDDRGYFYETFRDSAFKQHGILGNFIQDNQSFSKKGVLRGLHFQKPPFAQGKFVRVISGAVIDIAVDIRPNSPTFGQYESFLLTGENKKMVFVPEGFAHGFATLEDAIFTYKCTNVYDKSSESGIIYNDPELNINWGIDNPLISEKDLELPNFSEIKKNLI